MDRRGFTLVELMVVIAIIGILAAALFPAYSNYILRAQQTKAKTDIANLRRSVLQLLADTGKWPFGCRPNISDNHEGYINNIDAGIITQPTNFGPPPYSNCSGWSPTDPWAGPYINNLPIDPWGTNYYFDGDYIVCISGVDIVIPAITSLGPNKTFNYPDCAAGGATDDVYIELKS